MRLQQIFDDQQPLFFITFNSYRRKPILANDELHAAFIAFCRKGADNGMIVGVYCIMPDHVHFFVWINRDGCGLSKFIKSMKQKLGVILRAQALERPFWQEGFFDHLLRGSESYREKGLYVSTNPVRVGLCESSGAWPYCGKIHDLVWRES